MSRGPDIEPLPDDLDALLDAERARDAMPRAAQGRILGRLDPVVGGAGGGGGGAAGGGSAAHSALGKALGALAKLAPSSAHVLVASATLAVGGGVAYVGARTAGLLHHDAPVAVVAQHPVNIAAPAPSRALPAPLSPAGTAPLAPTPAVDPVPVEPGAPGALGAEQALLRSALAALDQGQPDAALALLDRHAREFPHPTLGEERDGLRVQCLVAAGRTAEARDEAARFRERYPRSIFQRVVDAALARATP